MTTKDLQPACDYWAKMTSDIGYRYRLAGVDVVDYSTWLKQQYPEVTDWQELTDSEQQHYRAAGYCNNALVVVFNAEQGKAMPQEGRWLDKQLGGELDDVTRYAILAGNEGNGGADDGAIICSCYQIGENVIKEAIVAGCHSAQALGETLKCGTNCGSCIPELNALIQQVEASV